MTFSNWLHLKLLYIILNIPQNLQKVFYKFTQKVLKIFRKHKKKELAHANLSVARKLQISKQKKPRMKAD